MSKEVIRKCVDGEKLRDEKVFRCERGKAVVTSGEGLCNYVFHAVGSIYDGNKKPFRVCSSSCVNTLESCYTEIVHSLKDYPDIRTIVIPIIGAGNYGFPPQLAIRIAISSVGNALVDWKVKDPELFSKVSLEQVIFCIYSTDQTEQYKNVSYAYKVLKKYKQCFEKDKNVVYQNSWIAHLRYMTEVWKYDKLRGYFAVAKGTRFLMMLVRLCFFPLLIFKEWGGGCNWQRRRTIVEIVTVLKLLFPLGILLCSGICTYSSGKRFILSLAILYCMTDTVTYLLLLIIMADIQVPSANVIRSIILLLVNYAEVELDISVIYFLNNYGKIGVYDAISLVVLDNQIQNTLDVTWINRVLEYTNAGIKFFFMTVAFGYFANHLRQRRFRS